MSTLETLKFDNLALRSLPIDPEEENYVRQVPGRYWYFRLRVFRVLFQVPTCLLGDSDSDWGGGVTGYLRVSCRYKNC